MDGKVTGKFNIDGSKYQICVRCVMDTSDRQIVFDAAGQCNHCTTFLDMSGRYRPNVESADQKLNQLVLEMKAAGSRNRYDCILGMSGGVDSSYAAYYLHKQGIRSLAVHMDNGWDSEESVSNILKITNSLGIDYESYVLDWEHFRGMQIAFLKASIPEAETPTDIAIQGALHRIAVKYNIKYIVSAGNIGTEGILPKSWHYNAKDLKYLKYIQKTFGNGGVGGIPVFDYKREIFYKFFKGIQIVYPMNYMSFKQASAIKLLVDEFNFNPPVEKHYESRYTRFIQSFYLYKKFGIDYRRAKFASEVCSGQVGREEALQKLQIQPFNDVQIESDKLYVAKKLQISLEELNSYIAATPQWYWDYPNDERKLQFIYRRYMDWFGRGKTSNFQK